jgi:hypothetical protein
MIYAEVTGGLILLAALAALTAHWLIDRGRERTGRRLFTDRATARRQAPGHGRHAARPQPPDPPRMIPAPAHSPDWEGKPLPDPHPYWSVTVPAIEVTLMTTRREPAPTLSFPTDISDGEAETFRRGLADALARPTLPTHHDAGPVRVRPGCDLCGSYGHWTRDHTGFPEPVTLAPTAAPVLPGYAVDALGGHFTAAGAYDSMVGKVTPVSDDVWDAIVGRAFGQGAS